MMETAGFKRTQKEPYKRLAEINRAITSSLNFDQVLKLIVENAVQLVDARLSLLLISDEEGQLKIRASHGVDERVHQFAGRMEEDVIRDLHQLLELRPTDTITSVPIMAKGSLDGLLVIVRDQPVGPEEEWQ